MKFKERSIDHLSDLICGNEEAGKHFVYRSSGYLTDFFRDADTDYRHDGSTRKWWVKGVLQEILAEPSPDPRTPPDAFLRVIRTLMDQEDAREEDPDRPGALSELNKAIRREGLEAFYGQDRQYHLRFVGTITPIALANPHRPFSKEEHAKREQLTAYLDRVSEDKLIAHILLPLFRQLGFHRVSVAGHKDKALEYGKDVWMKFTLPTMHVLYFGLQVKKGKLDSSGVTKDGNANVAELLNQVTMMLGHEIFDPETSRRVLVDHAYVVSAGEITKAARNWLGSKLDASKRSQVMFMDRDDILNLYVVTNMPLPEGALPPGEAKRSVFDLDDDIPF